MKKKLVERWKSDKVWNAKWEILMKCLLGANELGKLDHTYYLENGFLDLRGFVFDKLLDFKEYTNNDYVGLKINSHAAIQNITFENVDFSYVNLNGRHLINNKFVNCIFDYSNLELIAEHGCEFVNCRFYKTKLNDSYLGFHATTYKNVIFDSVNLKRASIEYVEFEDCTFKNCQLNEALFQGSYFTRVKFIGKVYDILISVIEPLTLTDSSSSSKSYYEKNYKRSITIKPILIDFSEAELYFIRTYADFDFSNLVLPSDGSCYLILDVNKAKKVVEEFRDTHQTSEILFRYLINWGFYCQPCKAKLSFLCSEDIKGYMEEITDEKERELAIINWSELREELVSKNLMINKTNATWHQ